MNKLSKFKLAIVLPAYNEATSLDVLLSEIKFRFKKQISIVVVDDGSSDETFNIASKYTDFVLKHMINLGKGAALRTGCEFAFSNLDVDYVIMMDADSQHVVGDISKFIEKINQDQNLIFGVRSFRGMPKSSAVANKITSILLKLFYGVYIPDILSGYKAFNKATYQSLKWKAIGYEVEIEIARIVAKKKIFFTTLPIKTVYLELTKGMSFIDAIKVWFNLFGLR